MTAAPRQLSLFDEPSFYESGDLELKSARGGLPGSLWETYSAFANSNGGTIFLGIAEKGNELDIHGIAEPSKFTDLIWSTANNRGKISVNLLGPQNVLTTNIFGKDVIKIVVPRASRQQRPVYVNNDPLGGTYRRDHTGDYHCTPDEVRRMFADQSSEPADSRILAHFGLDDLHLPSLQQYRNRVASSNPTHPWLLEDDRGFLSKLGGWRRDRSSGAEGLTVAGLLMFGTSTVIQSPEALSQFHLDYRERLGEEPSQRWSDRITLDGTWEGNLFQFYNRVLPSMVKTLKAPFQIDQRHYRFDETSVGGALREAVVNALIHADYGGQGGVVIDRYGDRIELSNPGTLLVSHEQLLRGGISECRNKALQLMFQLMGAGDKAGSGMDKIRTSWADARFRAPSLKETQRPDRVALTLPMVSVLPETSLDALTARFGSRLSSISPEDIQILAMTLEEGEITNSRLQEVLTVHRTDLTKTLQQLVKADLLKRTGFGRWTRYELADVLVGGQGNSPQQSTGLVNDVGSEVGNDVGSEVGSDGGFGSGSSPGTTYRPDIVRPENEAAWIELEAVARRAQGRRLSETAQQELVLILLSRTKWLTSAEFGLLLGRDSNNFQNRILRPLVRSSRLRQRHAAASHPYQAYALQE